MLKNRILLLGECPLLPRAHFQSQGWEFVVASSLVQAKSILSQGHFSLGIVQIDAQANALAKEALELSMVADLTMLALCPGEKLDTLSYQFRKAPILVLPLQTSRHLLIQVLDFLAKEGERSRRLQESIAKEKRKLQEEKLVAQAKMQLVSVCRWSEERAHQYVLKTAMDHSLTKGAAARLVLRKLELYENKKNKCDAPSRSD